MNFYRRFPGDYLIETMTLSWLEDCAYTRLLDWQYRTERSIERLSDAVSITRARTADEKQATKSVYERHFPRGINKRFAEELTYTNGKRKKAKDASVLGVAARKKQPNGQPNGQSDGQPDGDLSQTPDTRRQTLDCSSITSSQDHLAFSLSNDHTLVEKRSRTRVAPPAPPLFSEFWNRYPARRRGDEARAIREFASLSETEQVRAVESLAAFKDCEEWQDKGGRFIPNSHKFLRQRKFTAPPEARQKGATDAHSGNRKPINKVNSNRGTDFSARKTVLEL